MSETIARFHPLIVHLPIACLLLAALFQYYISYKQRPLQDALHITLIVGTLSAFFACITGYFLSEDHAQSDTMKYHKWLGLATFLVSSWALYASHKAHKYSKWLLYALAILVGITGHFGGSLTHGEGYLFAQTKMVERKEISDIQEALVYEDIISPILSEKCYNCHSNIRQKGKLRLDQISHMLSGGENGPAVLANQSQKSLIVHRMSLPINDEKHMPPKNKPQPTMQELSIIQWWIDNGASSGIKTKDYKQDSKIKHILSSWNQTSATELVLPEIKNMPDDKAMQYLNSKGVSLQALSKDSKLYTVNFIANDSITRKEIEALSNIKDHIYTLKLGHCKFDVKILENIGSFKNLHNLYVENTNLKDKDVINFVKIPSLQYLNVISNSLSINAIDLLCQMKSLKQLYVYQNNISHEDFLKLKLKYPNVKLVMGE
ncbi:MAG: hypothetical protein RLZZ546_23 [Bacteroidota bacterium]